MKTSDNGINLIKKYEGCKLTAYKCPAGVWTIGYGHTSGVKEGQTITQTQAESFLKSDLEKFEKHVAGFSKYNWNQNQFDALVSFAYNIGSINQLTNNGTRTIKQISEKITAYNKAAGKVLEGLTKRRKAEKELFDTAVKTNKSTAASSTTSSTKKSLKVGSQVKIKSGAKDANNGKQYASFVYKKVYTVISISGDYVVFGLNGVATGKTKKSNVTVQ